MAMLSGKNILVKSPDQKPVLGQYSFYPEPTYDVIEDNQLYKELSNQLAAYIQTTMIALRDNRTGINQVMQ